MNAKRTRTRAGAMALSRPPLLAGTFLMALSCGGPEAEPPPASFAAPSAYTAKVKNLLTGEAPTNEEVEAVTRDPSALRGLIDGWMGQPEYRGKMIEFFKQAFQQTQITWDRFDEQVGHTMRFMNPTVRARMTHSAEISFALTALELIDEGRPFTEVLTTERFVLNPPLMALLAYLDGVVLDDQGEVASFIPQKFGAKFKFVRVRDTPIPFEESIDPNSPNFLTFYDPTPPLSQHPICVESPMVIDPTGVTDHSLRGPMHRALFHIMDTLYGQRILCGPTSSRFTDADWDDWRMVRIRPPEAGEERAIFWDLPGLRSAQELVLNTPRVGFMTTPAFLANWPTNLSNLARVTVNQALIVGLGRSFTPDVIIPMGETGKPDAEHAQPGTTCFGCHQTLDPMRNFFRQSFSVSYHAQTSPLPPEQADAEFVLDSVVVKGTGGGVRDLAAAMAQHPGFAAAWTQKLCHYANSSPCAEGDPEFQRVVEVFRQSDLEFKVLVRELLSSPLVTQAAETQTSRELGTVISVSRRDHFCAALQNRLGLPDPCMLLSAEPTTNQNLAVGVPGSSYSRGTVSPLLPHDPDLFFASAVENLCGQVAGLVIDPADCPPGRRCWQSEEADEAIRDFTRVVMALPASDPRAADMEQILLEHHEDAREAGVGDSDALKSTFVLACSSPLSSSIGL
ncbi:hypothetical protein ACMHYB_15365 [Sorangium sp. So ce1128]